MSSHVGFYRFVPLLNITTSQIKYILIPPDTFSGFFRDWLLVFRSNTDNQSLSDECVTKYFSSFTYCTFNIEFNFNILANKESRASRDGPLPVIPACHGSLSAAQLITECRNDQSSVNLQKKEDTVTEIFMFQCT